ncbi:MAG: histone deacetylase family protein, partial [Gammaproteobacteria bacterium]|nr:histone deacetylase family protein [Gammaproteobacteria bacterium]
AHDKNYVDKIFAAAPSHGQTILDADTSMNPWSLDAARRAVGAGIKAIDLLVTGQASHVFCNTRPPGHHAEHDRAMGFCIFNAIAIAAMKALQQPSINKVAILDFDVHHGNGTEDIVQGNQAILFCSSFQHPFYPFSETSSSYSTIVKTPLAAETESAQFRQAIRDSWFPAIDQFQPDIILVSAGFDAHMRDPLGGLALNETDYFWLGQQVAALSSKYCQFGSLSMLEGGYQLEALAASVESYIRGLNAK